MKLLDFDLGDQTSHVQLAANCPGREASRLEACDMHLEYIANFVNETLDDDWSSTLCNSLITTKAPRPGVGEAAVW